jgi:hypothetical protein
MTALVLLDRPEYLNIPYFEMANPSSRENQFTRGRPCRLLGPVSFDH